METQQEIDTLATEIYRDKVLRARAMKPEDRLIEGARLFDEAMTFTRAGIMAQLGTEDQDSVFDELVRRLELSRRISERGFFQPLSSPQLSSKP
jgi:hypothetical protein